jgi:hypothetical protein
MINLLTDYLGIRGINFNLRQFLFGFDTMKATTISYEIKENTKKLSDMLNIAMESDEGLDRDESRRLDKGKGVDRGGQDMSNSSNEMKPILTDPEDIRRKKVLDDLNKDALRRRPSFILEENAIREQKSTLATILSKMEIIRDYNRINHKSLTINSRCPEGIDKISKDEIKCLVNTIINDPDVLPEVREKVSNGTIPGRIGVNSVIIKYLESKTK